MNTKSPTATIAMKNGTQIVIELIPNQAPNTVNSFIYLAQKGAFDNYKIARVEPGFVVDISTNAYNRQICRYLIENEAHTQPENIPIDLGMVCMGGYAGNIAGGEFFFPLARQEQLDGNYPCFGKVLEGLEEILRIGSSPVQEFSYCFNPNKMMHKPAASEIISTVQVETHGIAYPEPKRLENVAPPKHWFMEDYDTLV